MTPSRPIPCRAMVLRPLLVPLVVAALGASGEASDVPTLRQGLAGHPQARLPLGVYLAAAPAGLESVLRAAVAAWNQVSTEALGVAVLRWQEQPEGAAIVLRFGHHGAPRLMGLAEIEVDEQGVIGLPVEITLFDLEARGQTSGELVLFQVAAHELGHALGLPHQNEPGSLMCCDVGALDLGNAQTREAYVAARRRPDVGSVRAQLGAHYRQFWGN